MHAKGMIKYGRRKNAGVLAVLVAAAITVGLLVKATTAAGTEITAFEGGTDLGTKIVKQGSGEEELKLPKTLSVTLGDDTKASVDVTWSGYDLDTPGRYLVTPAIEGYTTSVPLPYYVLSVAATDQSNYRIEGFEPDAYQAELCVSVGAEKIALPDTVRAICALPEEQKDGTFKQERPADSAGYTAPEEADALYESGETVVYTYEEKGDTQYRIYGSIDDTAPAWYVSNQEGKPKQMLADVFVTWDTEKVDTAKTGEYTVTGSYADETISGDREPKAKITVTAYALERDVPKLEYMAVEENRELLDYYLSPVVRVLIPVDMTDREFQQAVPTEEDIPNDTFYRFGYNAPEKAEDLYKNGEIAVYTAYASPMEYSDRVVVTYRVFGSVDGAENAWYVCDEKGNITHRVEERNVEWDLTGFDILVPGEYKITGAVAALTDEGETPLQAELDISVSEFPELPELEHEH